jgi:hypothetical protein
VTDNELIEYAKVAVGREHGLTEAQARRLVGSPLNVLHADAATMAGELGVESPYAPSRDRPVTTVAGSPDHAATRPPTSTRASGKQGTMTSTRLQRCRQACRRSWQLRGRVPARN